MTTIYIKNLIDDRKYYEIIRQLRWPDGLKCPARSSSNVKKRGFHSRQAHRQRYGCTACHHQPLRTWILCLYLMGLNLSNEQIVQEMDLSSGDVQAMASQLRTGIVSKKPAMLSGEVEADEVCITAGYKGNPEIVAREKRKGRRRKLREKRGRGTLNDEKPPVLGMTQRNDDVYIEIMPNVQKVTIKPVMTKVIKPGSMVYADEYNIYNRLPEWGYQHKSVSYSAGEYACDENRDGFHEGHVNTMEGFWSLLRS